MSRFAFWGIAIAITAGLAAGCGKDAADESASGGGPGAAAPVAQGPPPSDPIARVAYDFLDAVIRGDDVRASACLTPKANQRLIEGKKRFALPGVDSTRFQVGEVRQPNPSQAIVQCILSDVSPSGQGAKEEICCLLREVDQAWRVSGIAASSPQPGPPPRILDF
jgi:hypothetical protein